LRIVATISFEQFRTAIVAMRKKYQPPKKTRWLNIVFIVVASFTIAIAIQTSSAEVIGVSLLLAVFLVAIGIWSKWRVGYCLKQTYEVQKKQLNGQIMDIDDSGINGQWGNGDSNYQYKWSAFETFLDLPDAFLFLPNPVSFVRVPKESLSFEDQLTIKSWAEKINPTQPPAHQ
jgi:hypothetical protein